MRIDVTQEHIDRGVRCGYACPVAHAIVASGFVRREELWVKCNYVTLGDESYPLPAEARIFVRRFDNYELVEPFSFDLED